jgi:hypothetical protein
MGYSSRTSVSPLAPLRPGDQIQPEDQRVALGKEPMEFPLPPETQRGSFTLCEPTLVGTSPPQRARNTWLKPLGRPCGPDPCSTRAVPAQISPGRQGKGKQKGALHPFCHHIAIVNPTLAIKVSKYSLRKGTPAGASRISSVRWGVAGRADRPPPGGRGVSLPDSGQYPRRLSISSRSCQCFSTLTWSSR